MPTGYYAGQGKTYLKSEGRWVTTRKTQGYDYDGMNQDSAGLLISFFRFYPDYFCDVCRSPNATYRLEVPQRLMLRALAQFRNVYITGVRGLTKTYIVILSKMIRGILYPGIKMRYNAPNQKQASELASQAFHQIEKDYPLIATRWKLRNDRQDMFKITTDLGSEFTMYAPRGTNSSEVIGEEIGAEGADGFDMDKFEKDILPTCRIIRMVNQEVDKTFIQLQHSYISNACSKQNRAFTVHRASAIKDMVFGEEREGFAIDMSWVTALMGNLRDVNYIKDQKQKLTQTDWQREMCAKYTGTEENPMISDEVLTKSKKLMVMEDSHCGNPDVIYIVSHDVSYADKRLNAKCADVVIKLTKFTQEIKRDKYRKQVVYVDNYPPPATDYLQGKKLKDLWLRYCLDGANATYLCVDAQAYGTSIVEELCKPSNDGTPCLRTMNNNPLFAKIEQPNALPVLYAMKATTSGGTDADGDMIAYAQSEFEQGNVEILTGNILDGVDAYKNFHNVKDDFNDGKIASPYRMTGLLCEQIANLKTEASGLSYKEKRKSPSIQRDIWSALKYGLRIAQRLEDQLKKENYKAKSSWSDMIANHSAMPSNGNNSNGNNNSTRLGILGLRRR